MNPDSNISDTEKQRTEKGTFRFDRFLNQLAVGTGFGLRIDTDFFVLRFDFGYPLRKPYLPEGQRWIDFSYEGPEGENEWSFNEIVFNIGIGYPF